MALVMSVQASSADLVETWVQYNVCILSLTPEARQKADELKRCDHLRPIYDDDFMEKFRIANPEPGPSRNPLFLIGSPGYDLAAQTCWRAHMNPAHIALNQILAVEQHVTHDRFIEIGGPSLVEEAQDDVLAAKKDFSKCVQRL